MYLELADYPRTIVKGRELSMLHSQPSRPVRRMMCACNAAGCSQRLFSFLIHRCLTNAIVRQMTGEISKVLIHSVSQVAFALKHACEAALRRHSLRCLIMMCFDLKKVGALSEYQEEIALVLDAVESARVKSPEPGSMALPRLTSPCRAAVSRRRSSSSSAR